MSKVRTTIIMDAGFALGVAILVLLGWLTFRDIVATERSIQEVDYTYSVLNKLNNVFSALKDAETGQRGYIITGKIKYLEPYYKETGGIEQRLSALHDMTRNNPEQQKRLDDIESVVREKIAALKETIEIRRAKGFRFASRIVDSGIGEKLMEQIRGKVATATDEETRLLYERFAARRTAARRLIGAVLAGGALSIALLLTAFFFLKGEISMRIKVEGELCRHQEGLEDLVQRRTRDIAETNSRLKTEIAMREQAEEDLKKSMKDLARSNKELDQFASVASHDLQSPLRTVSGFLDLLARNYNEELDEKAHMFIERAVNGTKRMSVLVHDLYVYSRIGTKEKQFSTFNMSILLNGAIDNLKEIVDENKATINSDELPYVEGDDTQLIQLFQNLIGNAIKFRKKDAPLSIRISAERKQDEWVFGVHDNGIGIEPRFYERIFVIFQRLHTSEDYPGTGLGLALCKKIVERHGGRIWIESRPDEGSSFYFTMPVRKTV